jgi:hypothetical protein
MNRRPVRGGCRRLMYVLAAMFLCLVACSGDVSGGPEAKGGSDQPVATAAPVQPALCGAGTVISDETADTATPRTEDEMVAYLFTHEAEKPDGYLTQTVVVDEGFGSFSLSMPDGYSAFWRAGTSPDILLEVAEPLDGDWVGFWEDRMRSGDTNARAIAVDGNRTDAVSAVLVTLTESYPESGSGLAELFARDYSAGSGSIGERCGVRANGAEGAYVEHVVPGRLLGSDVDRTQLQFLIPDPANELLWGVTCDVPESMAAEVKQTCRDIAATFRPLPGVRR